MSIIQQCCTFSSTNTRLLCPIVINKQHIPSTNGTWFTNGDIAWRWAIRSGV
jgi:hypothetical protein